MTDVEAAEDWLDDGRSGQLTAPARAAATKAALPMLASYFATGADTLRSQGALEIAADDDLGDLLEFVQVRVLLAAAEKLDPLLRTVLDRPSFRYQRVSEESIGVIRGRLDSVTYLRRRHEVTAPRRFPVVNVVRSYLLPENVMATWAALSVAAALKRLPLHRLPADAPERRRVERTTESLRRLAMHPAFSDCTSAAESVWRADAHASLVDRARSRIRSGRVPNAGCYEAVANWVMDFRPREVALDPGNVEWMFYDESFDTRLFELWSLRQIVDALSSDLGEPTTTRLLVDRAKGPIAQWAIGAVLVEVWFQAGLGTVDVGEPRWSYAPREQDEPSPAGKFGGIPDISIVVQQPGQPRQPVLVDPKLRQRRSVPGAEVYKIIGYFGNLPSDRPNRGAIIFHGPSSQRSYRIADGGSGEILAVAVDPLDADDAATRFRDLAEFVMSAIPKSTITRAAGPADPDDGESVEEWVDSVQQQAVAEMSSAISPAVLERSRKALRANLLGTWEKLDDDTQRMLATAEHFGNGVTPDMDHSGPLLGLAAACERLLGNYLSALEVSLPPKLTFGRLLQLADNACTDQPGPQSQALRSALSSNGVDLDDLHHLVAEMYTLNSTYRIPAAHTDVLEEHQWFDGRAAILLGSEAALPRIVRVLGL